jgi:hypothetical protein
LIVASQAQTCRDHIRRSQLLATNLLAHGLELSLHALRLHLSCFSFPLT